MNSSVSGSRLHSLQCASLVPVEKVHENPWFCVFNRGGYFTVENKQLQVIVLPIVENNSMVMVRVQRPVVSDDTLELPAGGAKMEETPVGAAQREFFEETGINIPDLGRFHLQPPLILTSRSPYLVHIFKLDLTRKEFDCRSGHDREILSVECFSFSEVLNKIKRNEIYFGFQIAVLTRFLLQNEQIILAVDIKKDKLNA